MWINIPRQGTVIFLLISYLDLLHSANPDKRYVDGDDIQIVNPGPIAFFSNYKLTTGWEKHLEDISQAHIRGLLSRLLTSSKDSDVLSNGFDRDRNGRQRELINDKNTKSRYHIRIYLEDFFGFTEYRENVSLLSVTNQH